MYYNIKIKSKDSEFILESNNEAVVQREMDIYFAHIFNASEEFKSKIKKIEITNADVKSIKEIEEPKKQIANEITEQKQNAQQIKQDAKPSVSNTEANQQAPIPIIQIQNIQNEKEELPKENTNQNIIQQANPIINEVKEIKPKENPKEVTNSTQLQNQSLIEDNLSVSIEDILQEEINSIPKQQIEKEAVHNELLAQNTNPQESLDSLPPDISILPDEMLKFQQTQNQPIINEFAHFNQAQKEETSGLIFQDIKEEPIISIQNDQSEIDEIINMAKAEIDSIDIMQDKGFDRNLMNIVSEVKQATPEQAPKENSFNKDFNNDAPVIDFEQQTQNFSQINSQSVSQIDIETIDVTNPEIQNKYIKENNVAQKEALETSETKTTLFAAENISPVAEPQIATPTQELNFMTYLRSLKNVNLITDEFLICAFYMKNFLGQESFTMKQINSKLFQATGKIASTSIADDLIAKGFLAQIDEIDSKKYHITQEGENYFAITYQG